MMQAVGLESGPRRRKIFSVSEITTLVRSLLEEEFPSVTIEGEVSNFRPSSTGHLYFSLKDKNAVISVVMFKNRLAHLKVQPRDGMLVRAAGGISVYAKRGTYQLICESLEAAGEGDLLAMIEERKRRLAAEGLFDQDRKKPLPIFPSRVAVVTSPTGAAIRDILNVLKRRAAGVNLVILPTPVQGREAAPRIAESIRIADRHRLGDVVILSRGGGSLEDLLPFYEEEVVRAVAACSLPVISAVGHEIDVTLSDLAADKRAPTPSAAAEVVAASREELLKRVLDCGVSLRDSVNRRIERASLVLSGFSEENLKRSFQLFIQPHLMRFDEAREDLAAAMKERLADTRHRLELLSGTLEAHSPLDVLRRGFAVVSRRDTGRIVVSADQAAAGDQLDIRLFRGRLAAEVTESERGDQRGDERGGQTQ